ncbi:MAG TPA: glycosyltransferase family 4 protein [Telluria sp.]|nr:glycosyltransferase family 4 protein [Telluria sp.]
MDARTLRIALVGPLPPPAGGIPNQTAQLARLLREEGLQVEVVRMNAPYRPAWAGRLRGLRAAFRLAPYALKLWQAAARADVMHVMANSGWSWHLFAAPAVWIGAALGVPVVVNYRGGAAEELLARSAWLVRPTLARASAVIVPSGFLRDVFERFGVGCSVVPNVVDTSRFRVGPAKASAAPHIVVARNLEDIYDNATALRAFAAVRRLHSAARMTLAGSGPEEGPLRRLAAALGVADAVAFPGRLAHADMANLYATADIVLNASRVDNMPNALLEAMAAGVPVVSSAAGGIPYIVTHEVSGLLTAPGDAAAMAAAMRRVLDEPALAAALRAGGLHGVQRYTWEAVRPQLLEVYERLAQGRQMVTS